MLNKTSNIAILNIANILFRHQANIDVVSKALEIICLTANCGDGFIYGMDPSERFVPMERYTSTPSLIPAHFFIDEFTTSEYNELATKVAFRIRKSDENTPLESKLLLIYDVDSLIISPIVDENRQIYGFVTILNEDDSKFPSEQELEALSIILSMLVSYMSVRMYTKKFSRAKNSFESILDNTGIDIYVNDFYTHEILYVNKAMAAPYGGIEQFANRKCWQVLFHGQSGPCEFCPQKNLIDEDGNPTKIYSWDYQRPFDGSWFRVFSAAFKWVDGRLAHVVTSADITENKRNEELIENLAYFDQLTKLPNRRMLLKECEKRIENATTNDNGYVLFLDIDGFKAVNDTLGHDAGDELLIQLGEFFSSIPMLKGSIYRNGGDEFVALLSGENLAKPTINTLVNFTLSRFKHPWILKKGEIFCNASIGIACYPEDSRTVNQLLQLADMAMYHVKKSGGGGFCFGQQINIDVSFVDD